MDGEVKNTPSRLNRRELIKTTAVGGAALAAAKVAPVAATPGRWRAPGLPRPLSWSSSPHGTSSFSH